MKGKVRVLSWIAVLLLMLSTVGTVSVSADSGARTYHYIIGTGLLCGLDPSACPAKARATVNDDIIELRGEGTLTIHPKSVTGGGTFVHKDAAGNVLGSGTWTAMDLLSFKSYGTSPGFPPTFEGGLSLMRIHLTGGSASFDGILQVDCLIGKFPAGAIEGVRLAVPGLNFNKEVSGFTVFIRLP